MTMGVRSGCSASNILTDQEYGTVHMGRDEKTIPEVHQADKMKLDLSAKLSASTGTSKVPFKREILWKRVAICMTGHLMALYAFYLAIYDSEYVQLLTVLKWTLKEIVLIAGWLMLEGTAFGYVNNAIGIQMGAHRYYTHRSFKASKAMKVMMIICQTVACQDCVWVWVRNHRLHHKYSDTDADPHNAAKGFFFSHVGWLLSKKHPDVIARRREIDMSDLNDDPFVMFQRRHYFVLWLVFGVLPMVYFGTLVGGSLWNAFFISFLLRTVIGLNLTWLVGSWAHWYGMKPFDKGILPVDVSYVGILLAGEGWHNYHHTFPWDYKASELGMPYNLGTYAIKFFARLGMVWDLREASDEMILARAKKTGDGTPTLAKPKIQELCERGRER